MNRFWGRAVSAAVLSVVGGMAVPACAHDDASFFVAGVLEPPQPTGNVCTYTFSPASPMLARGLVDGALRHDYSPEVLLGSTLIGRANSTTPNSETARIQINGAQVRVVDPTDNSVWMNNSVLTSGLLDPASGTQPSYYGLGVTMMDAKAIAHFLPAPGSSKLAVSYVKFYGTTLGGQSIESDELQFPIDVCNSCLIYFPANAVSTNYCAGSVAASTTVKACTLGQDQPADCQSCVGIPECCPAQNVFCGGTCCPQGQKCDTTTNPTTPTCKP